MGQPVHGKVDLKKFINKLLFYTNNSEKFSKVIFMILIFRVNFGIHKKAENDKNINL